MIHIQGIDSVPDQRIVSWIRTAAQAAFEHQNVNSSDEITVALVDDEEIQRLNKEFLGFNTPTDVLSFPADEVDPETRARYRGDVIISLETARRQAQRSGHDLDAELSLLTVHGVLHLLGFDHADTAQKQEMWQIQSAILKTIGSPLTEPNLSDLEGTDHPA